MYFENILRQLERVLRDALRLTRLGHRTAHQASFEDFSLRQQLENRQRENHYLQFQLAKTRADKYELEQKPFGLRDIFADILNESEEQLREAVRFQTREKEVGTGWEVVTGYCCLGGCDMDIRTFSSERDALLFTCLLNAVDYHAPHNIACAACYAEYMKNYV